MDTRIGEDAKLIMTPAARHYLEEVEKRRKQTLEDCLKLPLTILVWGPGPGAGTPTAHARAQLRDELIQRGHAAVFSEEITNSSPSASHSVLFQEYSQLLHYDLTLVLPDSPGSHAETQSFSRLLGAAQKMVVYINARHNSGLANANLIQYKGPGTATVIEYQEEEFPGVVLKHAFECVKRIQEIHYMSGRRP